MRKVYKGQPRINGSLKHLKRPPTVDEGPGLIERVTNQFFTLLVVGLFVGTIAALYFGYDFIRTYLKARRIQPIITLLYPNPPTVGRTIACRIRFRHKGGKLIPFRSSLFQDLQNNIQIVIASGGVNGGVAVLQEVNSTHNHVIAKFSLRRAGKHEIYVKYQRRFSLTTDSNEEGPFSFNVLPGLPSHKYLDFGTHNPQVLCLTAGVIQYFKIFAKDEYGNPCRTEDVELDKLDFHIPKASPIGNEFCVHVPSNEFSHQSGSSCVCMKEENCIKNDSKEEEVCLRLRLRDPGIFPCTLKYKDFYVRGDERCTQKLVVCLPPEEEADLQSIISQTRIPGSMIYSCKCKARKTGEDSVFEGYVGISSSNLTIAKFEIALRFYPTITFPINGRTKMYYQESRYEQDEVEVLLAVQDGLRHSIVLELEPSAARQLLVTFAHIQGFTLPTLAMTFTEKKTALKNKLQTNFFLSWFSTEKILRVQNGNLIRSTLKEVPKVTEDWLLVFIIVETGGLPRKCPTSEWLNRLCEEFFTPHSESGMFEYLTGSKLLHPRSTGFSRQPLEFYKLAGSILGKAVVESLLRHACTILSNVRFSRSMLAFLLGLPCNYKHLETDEPKFFRMVKPILESDVSDQNLSFTTLAETPSSTTTVNLIQNGSSIPVTNENKEHYLNMLTKHRLIHPVEVELEALRCGFNDVICIDKLCDYNENDLESLISGGCPIDINNLMIPTNHRIVKEAVEIPATILNKVVPLNQKKILNWFRVAASNMGDREKSNLLFFATGSLSLPSCGWSALNPLFTISLTGSLNQHPQGHPNSHEIILGDHVSFDTFERTLLEAITPASERVILPTNLNQDYLQTYPQLSFVDDDDEQEVEQEETGQPSQAQEGAGGGGEQETERVGDPFVSWLREYIHF